MINIINKNVVKDEVNSGISKMRAMELMDNGAIISVVDVIGDRVVFVCVKTTGGAYIGTEDSSIKYCEHTFEDIRECIRRSRLTSTLAGWWDYYFDNPTRTLSYSVVYPQSSTKQLLSIPTFKDVH